MRNRYLVNDPIKPHLAHWHSNALSIITYERKMWRLTLLTLAILTLLVAAVNSGKPKTSGQTQDRGLGPKKKTLKSGTASSKYPWEPVSAKKIEVFYTDSMKKWARPDEAGFPDDIYMDYDFEFPKGMQNNDNFETKNRAEMSKRLAAGA